MMDVSLHDPERVKLTLFEAHGRDQGCVEIHDWSGKLSIYGSPAMCQAIADAINAHLPKPVEEEAPQ